MTPMQEIVVRALVEEKGVGCRDWPWNVTVHGYAQASVDGQNIQAGHVVMAADGRPRPNIDAVQIHSCDRPSCVAPWHLRWGTQQENLIDMTEKGRRRSGQGNAFPHAKLDPAKVREIRALRGVMTQRQIADLFGINQAVVSRAQRGLLWKHVA